MTDPSPGHITLPALPIVMPLAKDVMWISADGEIEQISEMQLLIASIAIRRYSVIKNGQQHALVWK